ncbi:hypothetical protein HHI36_018450 [Cryptolaemus montrouzieri]|uniref:USP domain-containing protein n=1 Tax=Cryptolaemus montrouzieri TaxID=559131 RepID=A0ABD2P0V2_9CUCU
MAVKQKVVECVDPATTEVRLQLLLRALQGTPRDGLHRDKVCVDIVVSLGLCQIPSDLLEFKQFISDLNRVEGILKQECANAELMYATLRALYNEISDASKVLSPAMSIVLQLIDIDAIPSAVKWILNSGYSDQSLERALLNLCTWLTKWTYTSNLGPLVLSFMQGLEADQHFDILLEVTLATIEPLFMLLILPDSRKSVGPVVLYMLSKVQNSPDAFHKIIPCVQHVITSLEKENSDTSRDYIHKIVRLCAALMEHFPGYTALYGKLKPVLQPYFPMENYKELLHCKSWADINSTVSIRSSLGKVGLTNLGNTCYMNSVLQALFMTKLFRNEVLLMDKITMPLFHNLQDLFVLLQHSQKCTLSPNDILHLARPPGFQLGHQHDSSEFLGYLLDVLHEQERTVSEESLQQPTTSNGSGMNLANTIVQQSFGGKTMTVSTCDHCGRRSERSDNFRELQLSFPNNSENHSVTSLLHYYLQPEKLCGDNQYHCDKCKGLTDGERVTHIIETPRRLILTLKHFGYDSVSQQKTKLLHRVKLEDYIQLGEINYELYAAVVHCGSSVDSGHYYTFAKDNEDWYKFNDCLVLKTTAMQLCELKPPETPYILFYRSQDSEEPDNLQRTRLSQRLQSVLNKDTTEFESEKRKRPSRVYNTRQSRGNDDPPPPGCGGGGFTNSSSNMYVC